MSTHHSNINDDAHATAYDRSINWAARFNRELPVFCDVFGPPSSGGLVDAGCGPGRQAVALAERGYDIAAVDANVDMLSVAKAAVQGQTRVRFIEGRYEDLPELVGRENDGVYCVGNALAAAGSQRDALRAIEQFAACLRPGGRMFVQVLNFTRMCHESPCIIGPRVVTVDGIEYVSVRQFHFDGDGCDVTNVTLWQDDGWKQNAAMGRLYPIERAEFVAACETAGLRVDATWGNYQRNEFDPETSQDLIVVATRRDR